MLISLVAGPLYVRVVFRSEGASSDVVRAVDMSWSDALDLQHQLYVLLEENAQRPTEEHGRGNLRGAKDER